jgi:hypothetical protein
MMVQQPSEDDVHNSVNDFAPEQPAIESRQADLESVVLWVADTWRESRRVRWFAGILIILVAAGGGLFWWGNQLAAPGEQVGEPIASSRVEPQPIESPAILPSTPLTSDWDRVVPDPVPVASSSIERDSRPVEKPSPTVAQPLSKSASSTSLSAPVAERPSPAPASDTPQVSPPMPVPATVSAPTPALPAPAREEEPAPVRAALSEPAPPPAATLKATPKAPGFTTWGTSRSGGEDAESAAIQDVLGKYRSAFVALDVAAVRQVWPSVNQRSLDRAFRQLEEQDVSFFSCTIDVSGTSAAAACVGTTNFIPKVGNRSPQSGPSQWNFKLNKRSPDGWLIEDAQAR